MESLVPTPDVFNSRIAECNSEGILAYASWKNIALVNVKILPPVFLDFLEHRVRVSALSFSKGRNPNLLVSGCDDGTVHVWDINHTGTSVSSFDSSAKILAVEWKCNADNIVFSSDERSCIVEWNITTHSHRSLKTRSKNFVVALASCPHDPNLLAAGHRSGDISIIDLPTTNVKYQLRGHTDDITHISWSPYSGEQLLSTSKDNSIRVWSIEKVDTLHVFSSVSPVKTGINSLFSAQWHPQNPDLIICSSQNFVGTWNLKNEGKPKLQTYSPKNGIRHSRPVALVDVCKPSKNIAFSVSVDRLIIFWDVDEKKPVYQLSTLGGSVYDLAFSTVAVGRLAIAVGDSNIRVWNVASSTTCPTQSLYVGTRSKVSTIAWHPERENVIAFGTDDGRVGLVDTNLKKTTNISASLHKTKVYKLSWGPCQLKTGDSGNALYLYSCGDGPIFIHSFGKDEVEDTVDFDELRVSAGLKDEGSESSHHTEISWKPDFSCLAVGNNDGCIEIYHGSTFTLMARLKAQKKLIQSLQWHPTFTSLSSSPSTLSTWLACASYETTIYVYDLTNVITKPNSDSVVEVLNATRELVGHSGRVTALVWSPHLEGRLSSASYDCSAQVWDVISGETLANFRDHKARIFSIAWNVLDPDIIFTGGDDMLVLQWRISEQTHNQPPSKGRSRRPKKKKLDSTECLKSLVLTDENDAVIDSGEFLENEECASEVNDNQTSEERTKVVISTKPVTVNEDGDSEQHESSELSISQPNDGEKSSNKGKPDDSLKHRTSCHSTKAKRKARNMLPIYGTMSKQSKSRELLDCMKLAENFTGMDGKSESMLDTLSEKSDTAHLAFFGNQEVALQWLNVEGAHHREVGNFQNAYELEMWKGNLGAALREAAERGDLNGTLVSLAPSVSHALWLEMCECYAKQLVQEKLFQLAALYLLACGKVYEAIDVLKSKNCFKDALAIAKARLPSSDPVIKDIISGWCAKLRGDGNYAIAAQWSIALNQPLKAASLLSDGDSEHLRVAAYICSKFGHATETKKYGLLCLRKSMLERKWDTARQMIDEQQPTMNSYKTLIAVHESVMNHIDILLNGTEQCGITERVFHNCHGFNSLIWKSYMVREQHFLVHVFNSLLSQGLIPAQENLAEVIEAVSLLKEKPGESHLAPNQAMMYASVDLTLFYLTLLSETEEKFPAAANYLNSLFKNCVASNYHGLLNNICLLSLPFSIVFNSEDLVMNLQVVGMADKEIISQFFAWLKLRIKEQNLLSPVLFASEEGLSSPETLLSANIIQETKEKVCSLTSVESILAYFFVNLMIQLEVLICEKNIHAKCYYKFQVESEQVPGAGSILQKSECESNVAENVSCFNEVSKDDSALLEDLLLEAEKKLELLKTQSSKNEMAENEIMLDQVPATDISELSDDKTNQEVVDQPSKTASSVDLTSDASCEEQQPELSDNDYDLKSRIGSQTEILLTESDSILTEETVGYLAALKSMVESPSSHSRCLQSLGFYFYFIHRMSFNLCNDNYALLFYLKKKLKKIQNALASRAAVHHFGSAPTLTDPSHMSEKGDNASQDSNQVQSAVDSSDSNEPSLQSDDSSSQQLSGQIVSESAINCEKVDTEKPQKCASEEESPDIVDMQKTCKDITEFLDAIAERNILFPDAIHASSQIRGLCNSIKERSSCQCIDEKVTEFISQVTSWAAKFDINRPLAFKSHGHSSVDESGDH